MAVSTSNILEVLGAYGIRPLEDDPREPDFPDIGEIGEGETVYTTSIKNVFGIGDELDTEDIVPGRDDERARQWRREIANVIQNQSTIAEASMPRTPLRETPPEPKCAWYCPIHYFGNAWGIYIKENCILDQAIDIARWIEWNKVNISSANEKYKQLLRSSFYVFFLHEHFHHKVESLGFRLLISTGTDRYRPYKANVYRRTFRTRDCLEESLATAESYVRLSEERYAERLDPAILKGLRRYLKAWIPLLPSGYREGMNYLTKEKFRGGLHNLQSQILDGAAPPVTPPAHWSVAPNMITSLTDISDEIYMVLPPGGRPIFNPKAVDPGATASTDDVKKALEKYYGYKHVKGGNGSHLKLKRPDSPMIILPAKRRDLSEDVIKNTLAVFGRYSISRLPDFLEGRLPERLKHSIDF